MAGITLEIAQQRLDDWIAADAAVAQNQSYTIGGRSLTRAHASEIRQNIDYWERKVNNLSRSKSGGARVRYGVNG